MWRGGTLGKFPSRDPSFSPQGTRGQRPFRKNVGMLTSPDRPMIGQRMHRWDADPRGMLSGIPPDTFQLSCMSWRSWRGTRPGCQPTGDCDGWLVWKYLLSGDRPWGTGTGREENRRTASTPVEPRPVTGRRGETVRGAGHWNPLEIDLVSSVILPGPRHRPMGWTPTHLQKATK